MSSAYVIDTTAASFEDDVIIASKEVTVLVDFWADWCGPCKSIAPVLQQLADEYGGKLFVVKVDTDAEQQLAQQFGIRSLPTMLVFRDGEVVEQIIGAQPAHEIKRVIEPYLPNPNEEMYAHIEAQRQAGDLTGALATAIAALEVTPNDHGLSLTAADLMVDLSDLKGARQILDTLPVAVATDEPAKRIEARIRILDYAKHQDPDTADDAQKRFDIAIVLAADQEFEEALDGLLELIVTKRDWQDGLVRKTILDIFLIMGEDDPRLKAYRTRLARTLN